MGWCGLGSIGGATGEHNLIVCALSANNFEPRLISGCDEMDAF